MAPRRAARYAVLAALLCGGALAAATWHALRPVAAAMRDISARVTDIPVTDRAGLPLGASYQSRWNGVDFAAFHTIPIFLREAFVLSEDRRFYDHDGVDWRAVGAAAWQNIEAGARVRGASTISQQVIRIIHDRPRTLWSKWIEAWEALGLERAAGKTDILEFYCNEVPYAANRRGVVQAASYYFNRGLSTLTRKEMLALVVMARAPSSYDLFRYPARIEGSIQRLAQKLEAAGLLDAADMAEMNTSLRPERVPTPGDATAFVNFVHANDPEIDSPPGALRRRTLRTTLDVTLQRRVHLILTERLKGLASMGAHNAAAIVVDHRSGEVLAWVVTGGETTTGVAGPTNMIDAVTVPRQPGSALKPFLYTLALEKGWTPATVIDDSPMAETIGSGLHEFNNYSHSFYGPISLREALANSLNIPALRTIKFVGPAQYLNVLHALGFANLTEDAGVYKEGLALGNGEVSLFEMAQAFTALAHGGVYRPLRTDMDAVGGAEEARVFSPEAASLIANILSDPWARRLEFGGGSVLNIPVQTAVKTGTSTDYHDAWTLGFDSRYVVGIWIGNLDRAPMDGVTGAIGPALAFRSVMAELNQDRETQPLYLSPRLIAKTVCVPAAGAAAGTPCRDRTEYFLPGSEAQAAAPKTRRIELTRPTQGLQMAVDPRVPADFQVFDFKIEGLEGACGAACAVSWTLNEAPLAVTAEGVLPWKLQRGAYALRAQVTDGGRLLFKSGVIHFQVK